MRSIRRWMMIVSLGLAVGCAPGKKASNGEANGGGDDETSIAITNLEAVPEPGPADREYAGVFEPLDGTWEGTFEVWVDHGGQAEGPSQPEAFDLEAKLAENEVELQTTLEVTQTYVSETPYFQRVEIVDRYPDGKVVESRGVNKVQDGGLWCVVDKPDDLVVHEGRFEPPHTIIWSRDRREPKAFEYFREVVESDRYTIEGWGYYGSDDLERAPRMWFRAAYERQ